MPYAFGYQRVSHASQEETDLGLTSQANAIDAYFKNVVQSEKFKWGGFYVDPVVSGGIEFLKREAGKELGLRVQRGDMILIHKIDRGFRSLDDMLVTLRGFEQRGVGIHFIAENLGTDDGPMGALMLHILAAFAQFERSLISTRTKEALAVRLANGQPINGCNLMGFIWVGAKGNKTVARDDHDRSVMGNIVKWRKIGIVWAEIVEHIAKAKVLTSVGGNWDINRVRRAHCAELYLEAVEAANRKVEDSAGELFAYRAFCREHLGKRFGTKVVAEGIPAIVAESRVEAAGKLGEDLAK